MSTWTEDLKKKAIELYTAGNPTAKNSAELVKQIAEELDQTPNGVRMILNKANLYIKKEDTTSAATTATTKTAGEGTKRVSKESQLDALREAIKAVGASVDDDILGKLTGKAAAYFVTVLSAK